MSTWWLPYTTAILYLMVLEYESLLRFLLLILPFPSRFFLISPLSMVGFRKRQHWGTYSQVVLSVALKHLFIPSPMLFSQCYSCSHLSIGHVAAQGHLTYHKFKTKLIIFTPLLACLQLTSFFLNGIPVHVINRTVTDPLF